MPLTPNTKLGPYEIVSLLGAGGMGEVYRARDTRLDREVAIKVLPQHLSRSPEFKQRFEREAKSISQLTHPNICTLHDVGHHEGTDYLVMELLEGESLAQRLGKGPLPLDAVLKHGVEIASALDAAHRKGVVHRDLKPGNVLLTKTGAKLLDFGLAKSSGVMDSDPSAVTVTQPLTSKGTILGTFQYMAPEQLEGTEADARTDIFAFGAVLYEMATGKRAFEGASRASLIASIMSSQPRPISDLQPLTPPALDRLIRKCLAKAPDARWQSASDIADELRWIAESGSQTGAPAVSQRRNRERLVWGLTALACVIAILVSWKGWKLSGTSEQRVLFAEILAPEGTVLEYRKGPPAISPDGRAVVFVARGADGTRRLWRREFAQPRTRVLEGTEDASQPFWSPDSRSIGFFADGKLKRLEASGSVPLVLCDAPRAFGGAWNRDGVILFSPDSRRALQRVSASGGSPTEVTQVDPAGTEYSQRNPFFLPNGKHFLYSSRLAGSGGNAVMIGALDDGAPKRILEADSNAIYVDPGFVLYWQNDALRARPFDPDSLAFTGEPVAIAPETRFEPDTGEAHFTVSTQGMLVYVAGRSATTKSQLVLFDRTGQRKGVVGEPGNYYAPRFSHDGSRIAVDNSGVENNGDVWILEIARPLATRISSDFADESLPIWSPDDKTVVFYSAQRGTTDLYIKKLGSPGPATPLLESESSNESRDWSADGRMIVFEASDRRGGNNADLWFFSVENGTSEAILKTPFKETEARISPDGKWLAYGSNESGRFEVYVQSFPEPGLRQQVSSGGGMGPKWRQDGRELYYISPDGRIMAIELAEDPLSQVPAAKPLFKVDRRFEHRGDDFDVTSDGQTFVVNTPLTEATSAPLTLQMNWTTGLQKP